MPWLPPNEPTLRLDEFTPEVRPIYDPGAAPDYRQQARAATLTFLRRWHYMHRNDEERAPNFTWTFGLYLRGQLAGIAAFNPPAAGVCRWLYGKASPWGRRVLGLIRTCCDDDAPFNSESYLVSHAIRQLARLDHRFSVVVAHSDLAVLDHLQRPHVGTIYMASNLWWAGRSEGRGWRGFYNPVTGARISRKCGGRDRKKAECPPGWVIEPAPAMNRFLAFLGKDQGAQLAMQANVKVAARHAMPVWLRPAQVGKGTPRAYLPADKQLRTQRIGESAVT